ncbi:chemotaxis protein [Aeribacillus alveayuensis]|uniref:Two-component system chemotaxis response regulator CheV n=1 Tax=Aeribacillus alveayuensis TaxID=279215 RepID=A0ABT9VMZ6_9BACI|nr:two-component system chemotaxis response regulator CheV [Bacillus alveayuensis]
MVRNDILLESGTNELEIVEFIVGNNKFGINVMKVKEIIQPLPVTKVPHAHPFVEGIIELRGEVLPVVNVARALGYDEMERTEKDKLIVTEFNKLKVVFRVHAVTQIHRVSWSQIEKPSDMYQGMETQITGVVKMHDEMILLLDFERIVIDIHPESAIQKEKLKHDVKDARSDKKLIAAEDSPLLRRLLRETLTEAGFKQIEFFENGQEVIDYLNGLKDQGKEAAEEVDLIITDIEMPQMDGLHLTKRIKETPEWESIPVIVFSSLITDDLKHKGQQVGVDAQVSKPEIHILVEKIDELLFDTE